MTTVQKIEDALNAKLAAISVMSAYSDDEAAEWYRHIEHARDVLARHWSRSIDGRCSGCRYLWRQCPDIAAVLAAWWPQ